MSVPSVLILLDQTTVTAASRLRVELTSGVEADIFDLVIPNVAGKHTKLFRDTEGRKVLISINLSTSSTKSTSSTPPLFAGFCDSADFAILDTPTIHLRGRDTTGVLIDETMTAALAAKLAGRTASDIVTTVAAKFGFTARVDKTAKVWSDAGAFPDGSSVWSCLVDLAQKEAFDLYCTAERCIVFKKRVLPDSTTRTYLVPSIGPIGPVGPIGPIPSSLTFSQDKTLALALKVKVTGYDQKAKRRITFTAESRLRNRPNYKLVEIVDHSLGTKALVRARAEAALADISKDLLVGELTSGIDPDLRPGQAVAIQFTGDQDQNFAGRYFITAVVHELTEDGAFTTTVSFASKPLAEARDMTIEEVKPPPTIPLPG